MVEPVPHSAPREPEASRFIKFLLRMQGIQRIELATDERYPTLMNDMRELSAKAGIPTPELWIVDTARPNAFAVGKDLVAISRSLVEPTHESPQIKNSQLRAVVAQVVGKLHPMHALIGNPHYRFSSAQNETDRPIMDADEQRGILAHEITHNKHSTKHSLMRRWIPNIVGVTAAIGLSQLPFMHRPSRGAKWWGQEAMWWGTFLTAHKMTSKVTVPYTELEADFGGATLTGDPQALASGLRKLEDWYQQDAAEHKNSSHLPKKVQQWKQRFMSTYPSMDTRVERLNAMRAADGSNEIVR